MAMRDPSSIRVEGDIAYVGLTRGFEAIIDAGDLPLVEGRRWRVMTTPKGHAYAVRTGATTGAVVLMHRELMSAPPGVLVDHEDGDGLNNRRRNMRLATYSLNNANMVVSRRNRLGIKGVTTERTGRFSASIKSQGQKVHLGTYQTTAEVSAAYYGAARLLWGDFAQK